VFFLTNLWHGINNNSLVGVLILAALLARRPWTRGVALAGALLTSQYALAAVPFFLWQNAYSAGHRSGIDTKRASRFLAAFCGVFFAPFVLIFILWGTHSLWNAFYYTFGVVTQYTTATGKIDGKTYGTNRSILRHFHGWFHYFFQFVTTYRIPLSLSLVGVGEVIHREKSHWLAPTLPRMVVLVTAGLTLSLFVRAYTHYWLMFVGPLAVLSTLGVHGVVRFVTEANGVD